MSLRIEDPWASSRKAKSFQYVFWAFSHFFRVPQTKSPGLSLKIKRFCSKRAKENTQKETKPFCTLAVARLSSYLETR